MTGFASSVRFKVKPGNQDAFLNILKEFELPAGARPAMIAFLNTARDLLEETSADRGVTNPVSGPVLIQQI
jgi:hypothetical protein